MASGTGNLPNQNMDFTPFDILTAEEMDDLVENIESLADGTGIGDEAIGTSALADGAVSNAKLKSGAGEPGGAWTDWTPSLTNLSGGTLNYAKYTQIGKTVHFIIGYTLGGAGVSGSVTISLPIAPVSDTASAPIGSVRLIDTNGSSYSAEAIQSAAGDTFAILIANVASTYPTLGALSATVPFTWASSDRILIEGTYQAA